MAYTDFTFYENTYHGNVVPADDFERIADRASDFLDVITFDRLADGLPDDERAKTKVQKAISSAALSDMASGAKNWSAVYQEAGNPQETNKILESAARLYLMGVRDDKGVLLMYAGL